MEQEADQKARYHGDGAETQNKPKRAESMDTLNTEKVGPERVLPPRWMRQKYEEEVNQKSGSAPNLSSRSRFTKPETLPVKEDKSGLSSASQVRSPVGPGLSPDRHSVSSNDHMAEDENKPDSPRRITRKDLHQSSKEDINTTFSDRFKSKPKNHDEDTSTKETSYSRRFQKDESDTTDVPSYMRRLRRDSDEPSEPSYTKRISRDDDGKITSLRAARSLERPDTSKTESVTVSTTVPSTSTASAVTTESQEDELPAWRRRNNTRGATSTTSSTTSSGGVLLHKRRSREDSSLSGEEIAASLNEADSYWQRMYGEAVPETMDSSKMSDSTYSSGSGEEMARSESGHDLTEVKLAGSPSSPLSPGVGDVAVPRRSASWIQRYQQQRTSRTSDNLEDKVTLGDLDKRRSSQGSSPGSNRGSAADLEDKVNNEATLNLNGTKRDMSPSPVSSPVSRSSSESSSLPSVVKRLSTIEDPDIMNAPPSYQSPTVHVTSPGSGEPDTAQGVLLGRMGGESETDQVLEDDYDRSFHEEVEDEQDVVGPLEPIAHLQPNLGLKKQASPNESIDSMTPSEQENLLSKS